MKGKAVLLLTIFLTLILVTTNQGNTQVSMDDTPPAISNVQVTTPTPNSANINWMTDERSDTNLYYGIAPAHNIQAPYDPTLRFLHSVSLSNLNGDTNYRFCIIAKDASENKITDCSYAFRTPSEPGDVIPPEISGVEVLNISTSTVDIIWITNEVSDSYVEYGTTESFGNTTPIDSSLTLNHSISLTGLSPNTQYYFKVHSTDGSGNESSSGSATFSTAAEEEPHTTPPIISAISTSDIIQTSATISWTTDELADGQIEYGLTEDYGSTTALVTELSTLHSISLTNLLPYTHYHFRILSVDAFGNASVSESQEFTTLAEDSSDPDLQISQIMTDSISTSTARITWTTNRSAESRVEYGLTTSYRLRTDSTGFSTTTHEFVLSSLLSNTTYNFRVVSTDSQGNTIYSNGSTFKTLSVQSDITAPNQIQNLTASDIEQTSVTLLWEAPYDNTGIFSYDIHYNTSPITDENFNNANSVRATLLTVEDVSPEGESYSYIVTGLNPGTRYYFAIKSSDVYGNSSLISNNASVNTKAHAIPASASFGGSVILDSKKIDIVSEISTTTISENINSPVDISSQLLEDIQSTQKISKVKAYGLNKVIWFSWNNPSDSDFVRVKIVRSDKNYPKDPADGIVIYEGDSERFGDKDLINGKTYYYSIFAFDEVPNYSSSVKISISPNASKDYFHVVSSAPEKKSPPNTLVTKDWQVGQSDHEIIHIQEFLASDPALYPEGLITGYFGPLTENAIKKLQNRKKLKETGKIDLETRVAVMELQNNHIVNNADLREIAADISRDIYIGIKGQDVKQLQELLIKRGFLEQGNNTGYFGILTKEAVIKFQKKYGVSPTRGYVGPATRAVIIKNL